MIQAVHRGSGIRSASQSEERIHGQQQNLTAGQQASLQALFSHAEGDVDLRLFDPAGTQVATSLSTTDDENINYTATQSGTHVLQVELYRDAGSVPGNTYQLISGP